MLRSRHFVHYSDAFHYSGVRYSGVSLYSHYFHIQTLRSVLNTSKLVTAFESNHLTSFATGFRPQTNTIDFQFVFAFPSFEDNMTIFVRRSFTLVGLFSLFISNNYGLFSDTCHFDDHCLHHSYDLCNHR